MTEGKSRSIKWRRWHADALTALRTVRHIQAYSASPLEGAANATAKQIMRAAACYHVIGVSVGPEDDLEVSYLQQVEYAILAHISALHRFGYVLRWAIEPDRREISFAFVPKQPKPA